MKPYKELQLLTEDKRAWKIFLDHGLHLVDLNGDVPAKQWLYEILRSIFWHPETIALFLCRQGKGGLPIQNLDGCLHGVLQGTFRGCQRELTEALILLVKAGADVYARDNSGRTVSEIACCKRTKWYYSSWRDSKCYKRRVNHDLRLKEIWMEVLSVCGYDPEEVISASVRLGELSDSNIESSSDLDEDTSSVASDYSEGDDDSMSNRDSESDMSADDVDNDRTLDQEWESDEPADDVITRQPDTIFPHHYESLLLEGDADIWSS